jgi:hypothetical protein
MMEIGDGHRNTDGTTADGNEKWIVSRLLGSFENGISERFLKTYGGGGLTGGLAHMIWTEDMT